MHNDLLTVFGLTIHGYGLMIGLGIVASLLLSWRRARARGLSEEDVTSVTVWALLGGFLGAKLLFILTELPTFLRNPRAFLTGGYVVYGGILAAVPVLIFWSRKKKSSTLAWMDLLLPGVALAQSLGRIGCFLAGCCYGKPTDSPLGVVFPVGSLAPAGVRLLPTQLFSSAGDLMLCALLLLAEGKDKREGATTGRYLLFYGVGRFLIEFLRSDERGNVGVLSTSQFISLFVVAAGIILLTQIGRKKEDNNYVN